MKIIFLDIDGVLNVNYANDRDEYGQGFHPEFVSNLKRIIDETGAKIVISSSWRKSGLKIMQEMWNKRSLPGEVIDTTASLYVKPPIFYNGKESQHPTPKIHGYSVPRGCEIEYWLREHKFYHCNWSVDRQKEIIQESGIEGYVIIDDDTDMLYCQQPYFVKTSGNEDQYDSIEGYGLIDACTTKAIEILNKKLF